MTQASSRAVLIAYGRALKSQFSGKILLLSLLPFALSLAVWGVALYLGFQPFLDWMQSQFEAHDLHRASNSVLAGLGLSALKTLIVPLLAMLLLLPLMILTALLFIGIVAMPVIVRHVSQRQFPQLLKKQGGSLVGSLMVNLSGFALFAVLWLVSLPLYALPPVALLFQVVLWGWLTARVMSYDALADHASAEERATIARTRRLPLLAIGMVSGALGALPGIAWVFGTVLSIVLFPFLAALSVWLYVLIFMFTGLWFQYYCLQALADLRVADASDAKSDFVAN
ncbi:MAG: EI24 domain-containing protein [Gammaproteobacteria bacterium]